MQKYKYKKISNTVKWELSFMIENKIEETIAEIEFFIDKNGLAWLNSIEVIDCFKRKKIATILIGKGIKKFGEIYFSSASKSDHKKSPFENDNRYLEPDGVSFVTALIKKKIIKKEWLKNPFN